MSIHDLFPGPWTVEVMEDGSPNKSDSPCWIRHVNSRGQVECLNAVLSQTVAKGVVKQHNERIAK